ncbi:MAG: Gfo/Idh/MocA family oxidoreductase [Verrucomicrobia bacterium]|nr:Gfo/Idh/MocA family oxidoreductase [Verrucomicrobiota bacterium]MBI3869570.1 Gfo/Idh/MocA family oxidoreductase [Verrucomicrobiota bacterium]
MTPVRLGIVGMGNIGKHHAGYLRAGQVPGCELVSVCSPSPQKLESYRPLKIHSDPMTLIRSGEIDALLIATPHYQHATLGIAALEAGLHVMVEKPIAAHKADAERLIAAANARPAQIFAAMFQLRTEPRYVKIQTLLQSGELGRLMRVNWINTDWFRTDAYYASSAWRATWKGEGGGVLLNQALHNLDTLHWLLGVPSRVRAFSKLGGYHNIEVEDEVTAYLEWPGGATGVFVTSTAEAPGANRLEITGSRGRLVLENDRLSFQRTETDALDFSRTAKTAFAKPELWNVEIPFTNAPAQHATLMQNFVEAIRERKPLIAPGQDGIGSVELANAMLYSSLTHETVELPLDGLIYEARLQELIANSKFQKKVENLSSDDFAKSFRR